MIYQILFPMKQIHYLFKKSTNKSLLFILAILLLACSCSLDKLVQKKNKISLAKAPYDVIIIPGYPYKAPSNQELFTVRVHWAKALYDRGIAKNIIFSGDAVHTPYTEGAAMKLFAISLGIPAEHIFEETKALHTNQNIVKGKALAKQLGFQKIAFATDPYQFSYMVPLMNFYAPGTPLISFPTDSMAFFIKPLPEIDLKSSFVQNWTDKTE